MKESGKGTGKGKGHCVLFTVTPEEVEASAKEGESKYPCMITFSTFKEIINIITINVDISKSVWSIIICLFVPQTITVTMRVSRLNALSMNP